MAIQSNTVVEIPEDRRLQRIVVLLSVLSFAVLTVAILAVYGSPMQGYEYSVYNSTPILFWLAVIFAQLTGILLFYTYYGSGSRLWVIGFLQILFSNFILMTLYLYKGFIYLERTDSLSYVGYAKDIFDNGYFSTSNFYPLGSIIMSMTGNVSGQGMIMMSQIFPAIFFTAYTLGILCWSRAISTKPRFVTSIMLASMPIFFAWFIPTLFNETLCVLMLPLFFFILWKCMSGDARYKMLLALFIVFFIIGHPLVALTVLLFFGIILMNEWVTRRKSKTITVNLIMYNFVLLFGWIVYHALLVKDLRNIVEQFMGMTEGMSTFTNASVQASQIGLLSSLQSVLVCTIDDLVFVLLALMAGVMILRRGWRTHPMTVVLALFVLGGVYLASIILMTYAHNPFRLINLNFIIIFTIPLVGFMLYTLREDGKRKLARLVSVAIVLCLVSTVFTVYQDPNTLFPNASVTESEITGSKWLVGARDQIDFTFYTLQTKPWRYIDLAYGAEYKRDNYDIVENDRGATTHFHSFLNASTASGSTTYLVITTYDEMAYTRTWAATDKYNVDDFQKLTYLQTVNHLYKGGDMWVYSRSG
jgi:hypothetical protein